MALLGIKFLLPGGEGGSYFAVTMEESRAREIVRCWLDGTFRLKGQDFIGDTDNPSGVWAVSLKAVHCIHTFDPTLMQAPPPQPPGYQQQPPVTRTHRGFNASGL